LRQDAQSAENRFAWIVQFTRAIRNVPFAAPPAKPPLTPRSRPALTPRSRLLGGPKFVDRVRAGITLPRHPDTVPAVRRLACHDYRAVLAAVAAHLGIAPESFLLQRNGELSRDLAAWLARELTPVTLRELSAAFGLTHPDSVRNLIRRADRALLGSRRLRSEIEAIRHVLLKTENRP